MSEENTAPSQSATPEVAISTPESTPQVAKPAVDSATFAEMQRREKALRIKENKLKQELEAERSKWVSELKSNPYAKLQEYGVSSDSLIDQFLGNTPPPVDPRDEKLSKIEAKLAAQEAAEQQKILADYQNNVLSHVTKDPVKYELVNEHRDGKNLYWQAVVAYHQTYGEAPDYAEIAAKVEEELYEQGQKLLKLNKFKAKAKLEDAAESIAESVKKEEATPSKKSVTISNSMTASSSPVVKRTVADSAPPTTSAFNAFKAEKQAAWLRSNTTKKG